MAVVLDQLERVFETSSIESLNERRISASDEAEARRKNENEKERRTKHLLKIAIGNRMKDWLKCMISESFSLQSVKYRSVSSEGRMRVCD